MVFFTHLVFIKLHIYKKKYQEMYIIVLILYYIDVLILLHKTMLKNTQKTRYTNIYAVF